MRRGLHTLLIVSLLLLSWLQLRHELDLHAHQSGHACEFCLFTGFAGHAAAASVATPPLDQARYAFEVGHYLAPIISQPFRHALSERGPPALSFA